MTGRRPRSWAALALVAAALTVAGPSARAGTREADRLGDVLVAGLAAGAFAATYAADDPDGRVPFAWAAGLNLGATLLLNRIVDKPRPDGGGDDAFPSAHTSVAFQSAAFVQRRYGWGPGLPAYAVAAAAGLSRIAARRHDAADVLGGALVGVAASTLCVEPREGVRVEPAALGGGVGVRVAGVW